MTELENDLHRAFAGYSKVHLKTQIWEMHGIKQNQHVRNNLFECPECFQTIN